MAAKLDRLKVINKRKRITVDENGNIDFEKQVAMHLDATGSASFVFVVPPYVGEALELRDNRVSKPTADEAEKEYEKTIKQYAQWKRDTIAELVILVEMSYRNDTREDGERRHHYHDYVRKNEIGLGYRLAFRIAHPGGAKIYDRKRKKHMVEAPFGASGTLYKCEREIEPPEWTTGETFYPHGAKVFAHTQALQDKLDLVMKAISQAADVLAKIDDKDEAAFTAKLLGLGSTTPLLGTTK